MARCAVEAAVWGLFSRGLRFGETAYLQPV